MNTQLIQTNNQQACEKFTERRADPARDSSGLPNPTRQNPRLATNSKSKQCQSLLAPVVTFVNGLQSAPLVVVLLWSLILLPHPMIAAPFLIPELAKVMADDGQAGDLFGFRAALNKDARIMAVGAFLEDERGNSAGAVYLFTRQEGSVQWMQLKKIHPSNPQPFDIFGRWVDLEGDILVASGGGGLGAFIFERNHGGANNWGQVTNFTTGLSGTDSYGTRVSLDGDRLGVSAPTDDQVAQNAGACFLYERHAGGSNRWGQVANIVAYDGREGDDFSSSIDLDGDTLVVAAQSSDAYGTDAGIVYVYERTGQGPEGWELNRSIGPTESPAGDSYGRRVRLSGDVLIVGAPFDDGAGMDAGALYIHERNQGGPNTWGLVRKIHASDAAANDNFGRQVLVSGDIALAATFGRAGTAGDASGRLPGVVYLFHRDVGGPDHWDEFAKILPSDSPTELTAFGCCGMDLRNNLLMVGRGADNERGTEAGAVHLFEVIDTETIQLTMDHFGNQVRLSWPEYLGLSLTLEQSSSLSPPNWKPALSGTNNPASVTVPHSEQYFRLKKVVMP